MAESRQDSPNTIGSGTALQEQTPQSRELQQTGFDNTVQTYRDAGQALSQPAPSTFFDLPVTKQSPTTGIELPNSTTNSSDTTWHTPEEGKKFNGEDYEYAEITNKDGTTDKYMITESGKVAYYDKRQKKAVFISQSSEFLLPEAIREKAKEIRAEGGQSKTPEETPPVEKEKVVETKTPEETIHHGVPWKKAPEGKVFNEEQYEHTEISHDNGTSDRYLVTESGKVAYYDKRLKKTVAVSRSAEFLLPDAVKKRAKDLRGPEPERVATKKTTPKTKDTKPERKPTPDKEVTPKVEDTAIRSRKQLKHQIAEVAYHMGAGLKQLQEDARRGRTLGNTSGFVDETQLKSAGNTLQRMNIENLSFDKLTLAEQKSLAAVGLIESPDYNGDKGNPVLENPKTRSVAAAFLHHLDSYKQYDSFGVYADITHGAPNNNIKKLSAQDLIAFSNPNSNAVASRRQRLHDQLDDLSASSYIFSGVASFPEFDFERMSTDQERIIDKAHDARVAVRPLGDGEYQISNSYFDNHEIQLSGTLEEQYKALTDHIRAVPNYLAATDNTFHDRREELKRFGYDIKLKSFANGSARYHLQNTGGIENHHRTEDRDRVGTEIFISTADRDLTGRLLRTVDQQLQNSNSYRYRKSTADLLERLQESDAVHTLVTRSLALSKPNLQAGDETRYTATLINILKDHMSPNATVEKDLNRCGAAILHKLQDIESAHPGYLSRLTASDKDALLDFTEHIANQTMHAHRQHGRKTFLDRNTNIIALFHHEERFNVKDFSDVMSNFGISSSQISSFKGAADTTQHNPKSDYLAAIRAASGNREQRTLIWNNVHGGDTQLQLNNILHFADDHISINEFADAIVKGQRDKNYRTLKLDHLPIVLDACNQYNFSQNLEKQLLQEAIGNAAKKYGMQVEGAPEVVAASQRGTISYGGVTLYKDRAYSVSSLVGRLVSHDKQSSLTYNDLYEIDDAAASSYQAGIEKWRTRGDGHASGADLAIFSGDIFDIERMLDNAERHLSRQGHSVPQRGRPQAHTRRFDEVSTTLDGDDVSNLG